MSDTKEATREVAKVEPSGGAVAKAGGADFAAGNILALAREMALNPDVDAAKLETIMRVANEQQDREREIEFYRDKNAAVRKMPRIRKDGRIVIIDKNAPDDRSRDRVQGHYERWPDVQRAITPVLDEHHLTLTHRIDHADGRTVVVAVLTHDNGYREESGEMALPLDTSGGKNNVQGAGSSQSYGMRYTARAILGLKLEDGSDDDGWLTAIPGEPLNDQQQRRIDEGAARWAEGEEQFEAWYHTLTPQDRAWFISSGQYAEITGRQALPDATKRPAAERPSTESTPKKDPPPRSDPPKKEPVRKSPDGPDVSTPEGWTDQFVADCRAAETIIDLREVERKGKRALARLESEGLDELHRRASEGLDEAKDRLAGGEG